MEQSNQKPTQSPGATPPPGSAPAPAPGATPPTEPPPGKDGPAKTIKAADEKNLGWKTHNFNKDVDGTPIAPHKTHWFQNKWAIGGIGALSIIVIASVSVLMIKKPVAPASAAKDTAIDLQGVGENILNGLNNIAGGSNAKQTLNISANTNFKNTATVEKTLTTKDTIEAQKDINAFANLNVAGAANLNSLTLRQNFQVAGTASLQGNVEARGQLAVRGVLTVSSGANIAGNLSATGGISAGGPISTPQLVAGRVNYTESLTLSGHLITGGNTPTSQTDIAAGVGGSVTVSGNDTAGTVVITTGTGAPAGVLCKINFRRSFATVPKVLLTPVGRMGAKLEYSVARAAGFFTIETNNAPEPSKQYAYDYFVVE